MPQLKWIGIRRAAFAAGCAGVALSAPLVVPVHAGVREGHRHASTAPGCDLLPVTAAHAVSATSSSGPQQSIAVSVPAVAVIRVDNSGRIVAAMTNTGCPPQPADDVWRMAPDGSMKSASSGQFADHHWIGDFSEPGVYVAQVPSRSSDHDAEDD